MAPRTSRLQSCEYTLGGCASRARGGLCGPPHLSVAASRLKGVSGSGRLRASAATNSCAHTPRLLSASSPAASCTAARATSSTPSNAAGRTCSPARTRTAPARTRERPQTTPRRPQQQQLFPPCMSSAGSTAAPETASATTHQPSQCQLLMRRQANARTTHRPATANDACEAPQQPSACVCQRHAQRQQPRSWLLRPRRQYFDALLPLPLPHWRPRLQPGPPAPPARRRCSAARQPQWGCLAAC